MFRQVQGRQRDISGTALLTCFIAAMVLAMVTLLLLPALEELLAPKSPQIITYRTVNTAAVIPPVKREIVPVSQPEDKPVAEPVRQETKVPPPPVPVDVSMPRLALPLKMDFNLSVPFPDLTLDFHIDSGASLSGIAAQTMETPASLELAIDDHKVYRQEELDTVPSPVWQNRPVYPYRAKLRGTEGKVDVEFTVNTEGTTEDISIVSSTPPSIFDSAAVQAVSRWKFRPGIKNGKKAAARMKILISFTLE